MRLARPLLRACSVGFALVVLAADEEGACYGLRLPGDEIAPDSGEAHRHRCLETLALFPA